ncbi:ankyrin repeat-containing domain protein [Aspergillus crustosus]
MLLIYLEAAPHDVVEYLLESTNLDVNAAPEGDTPLWLAVAKGDVVTIKLLLDHGADANLKSSDRRWGNGPEKASPWFALTEREESAQGVTPMHWFFDFTNEREVLEAMIKHGGQLDIARTTDGQTPLHVYAECNGLGNLSFFRPLVTDWQVRDDKGNTLPYAAVSSGRIDSRTITQLLKAGLQPDDQNNEGCQPIHTLGTSWGFGREEALDILCAAGADLEAIDYKGRTLVARIARDRHGVNTGSAIPYLISRGANLNTQDYEGNGPFAAYHQGDTILHRLASDLATISDDKGILLLQQLLKNGVSPTIRNYNSQTPLHMLCSQASQHYFAPTVVPAVTAIDLVFEAGLAEDINIADYDGEGRNLLYIAATARQSNIIGLLLDHYETTNKIFLMVNARCKRGRTPLHDACQSGRLESVALLLDAGAEANLFARLGDLMTTQGWINKANNIFTQRLIPYLLAAGRRQLPNLDMFKVIVEQFQADVNLAFPEGAKMVPEIMFSSKVAADRQYKAGDTILHYLAKGGHWWHESAIKYLLQHGAEPNIRNAQGKTPLILAVQVWHTGGYQQKEVVKPLWMGVQMLIFRRPHDHRLVQLLLEHGALPSAEHPMELFTALGSFNAESKVGNNENNILHPIHYISMACFNDQHTCDHAIRMIELLLARGPDPYRISAGDDLIISMLPCYDARMQHSSYKEGDPTRATTLYERGADLSAVDNNGNNVLHLLMKQQKAGGNEHGETEHEKTVTLFLEKEQQLAVQRNGAGKTPRDIAKEKNSVWALHILPTPE